MGVIWMAVRWLMVGHLYLGHIFIQYSMFGLKLLYMYNNYLLIDIREFINLIALPLALVKQIFIIYDRCT